MQPLLDIESLNATVQTAKGVLHIVSDVSLRVMQGETLAIIGESGSGKTTLCLAMLRLLSPAFSLSGKVLFQGRNLFTLSSSQWRAVLGKEIALVFQDPDSALNPVSTIGDQIAEVIEVHGNSAREEIEHEVVELLKQVGLPRPENAFETYPHHISGGMKQRVMIAMAISMRPRLLILDEPTTALDLTVQKEILALVKKLQQSLHMTLVIVTHDMGVVAEMADHVAVMYASRVVEHGRVSDIFDAPLHPYTKALFAAKPTRAMRKQKIPVVEGSSQVRIFDGCPYQNRCPHVWERCRQGKVSSFGSDDHKTYCWLYEEPLRRRDD